MRQARDGGFVLYGHGRWRRDPFLEVPTDRLVYVPVMIDGYVWDLWFDPFVVPVVATARVTEPPTIGEREFETGGVCYLTPKKGCRLKDVPEARCAAVEDALLYGSGVLPCIAFGTEEDLAERFDMMEDLRSVVDGSGGWTSLPDIFTPEYGKRG